MLAQLRMDSQCAEVHGFCVLGATNIQQQCLQLAMTVRKESAKVRRRPVGKIRQRLFTNLYRLVIGMLGVGWTATARQERTERAIAETHHKLIVGNRRRL